MRSVLSSFDIFEFLGLVGMLFIVYAYILSNIGRSDTYTYIYINLIGAILLIISLIFHFNLGSFLIEVFWIVVTLFSLVVKIRKGSKIR